MITIKSNGKFIIPDGEIFIGHAGDNLNTIKEFFAEGVTDVSLIFRMYLEFDDGKTNFFLLESTPEQTGTRLVWNVTNDQILKSGIVKMQIKASNSSGTVFHSAQTSLVVLTALEFAEAYGEKPNSEYLQHEQYLNSLAEQERQSKSDMQSVLAQLTDISLMDGEPTQNSKKAATSGGIYTAIHRAFSVEPGSITPQKLSTELLNAYDTFMNTEYIAVYNLEPVSSLSFFSNPVYANKFACYRFLVADDAAEQLGVLSGTPCELSYGNQYQVITVMNGEKKAYRKVTKVAPSFTADEWQITNDYYSKNYIDNVIGTLNSTLENTLNGGV